MENFIADLLRGTVTSIMNTLLLFVLAKPKYSKRVTVFVIICVFSTDILSSVYFYSINNLTALAKFDVLFFAGLMILLKPFVTDKFFPWVFNCLTAMNIFFTIVFISYHLSDFFPYPYYSNTILRLMLYSMIIWLIHRYVSPFYHQIMENWKIYLFLAISMFTNFIYYILTADDIEQMLTDNFMPLILLIVLCVLIYITIFYFQQKSIANCILREEKQHYQELAYIDPLTGVRNRYGYESYISAILNLSCDSFCIGIYDVNDLKAVNDSLGHELGDKLIADASRIICSAFQNSAVFRIGGDEFVSVSVNVSEQEMEARYHEMLRLLQEHNRISSYNMDLSLAFGYAIQNPPFSIDQIFAEADRKMYKNKVNMKHMEQA